MDRIKSTWGDLYMLARAKGIRFEDLDSASGNVNISKTLFYLGAAGMLGIFTECRARGDCIDDLTAELVAELDDFLAPGGETLQ